MSQPQQSNFSPQRARTWRDVRRLVPASPGSRPCAAGPRVQRGFTLLESLIATVVLLLTVMAASMALWSGQRQGQFSQDAVQGTLAAAAKMEEVLAREYADLARYDGQVEAVGQLRTPALTPYPPEYYRIGRYTTVTSVTHTFPEVKVEIAGLQITVTTHDVDGTELCQLSRFVPEPQSE